MQKIPDSLLAEVRDGRLIPFVGSGVSLSIGKDGFPSWSGLLECMANRLEKEAKDKQALLVRTNVELGNLMDAASAAHRYLGPATFFQVMREVFDRTDPPDGADLSLPEAIWGLRPAIVVTTNYDDVLWWTNRPARKLMNHQQEELAELFRSTNPGRPTVWHVHGHISHASSLILAPRQYEAFYGDSRKGDYQAALRQLGNAVANYTFLFVGFGMTDLYVMTLLGDVLKTFGGALRTSYALLCEGEGDAERLWQEHNVQVLRFEKHGPPQVELVERIAREAFAALPPDADAIDSLAAPMVTEQRIVDDRLAVGRYLAWVARDVSSVDLLGLQDQQGRAVQLYQVYVPLTTMGDGEPEESRRRRRDALRLPGEAERKPGLLLDRIGRESLYISGGAGIGKSTLCRWLAYLAGTGSMPDRWIAPPEGYEEAFPEPLREYLPLLVRLREFWPCLSGSPGAALSPDGFTAALERWWDERHPGGLDWAAVQRRLAAGRVLLMLDGFDEVPLRIGVDSVAWHPRALLLSGLIGAVPEWTARGNRVLLTSRPYGLSGDEAQRMGLPQALVADLDDELQQLLVRRWFHVLSANEQQGSERASALLGHIRHRGDVSPLVANPMLLTAVCVIYNQGLQLPRDKHNLYDRILDNVLYNRFRDDPREIPKIRKRLSVIAYGMHTGDGLDEDRQEPQPEATHDEIEKMIQRYQDQTRAKEPGYVDAVETRDELLTRSGVLMPRPGKRAGFYHLTFQDFLAAQLVLEREEDLSAFFRRRAVHPQWRSCLSFTFSSLLARNTLPDRAIRLLEQLIAPLTLGELPLAVVVADCLEILGGRELSLQDEVTARFRALCLEAIEQEVDLQPRFELGSALGRLGDLRVAEDLRDHADPRGWVQIPAGKYVVGGGKVFLIEPLKKQNFVLTASLCVSRFPVTNGQYAKFIEDGGYRHRRWWSNEGWRWRESQEITEPACWRDARFGGCNQPVVGVSFWEAEAFCKWAGGRLPSEREWEAAARGPKSLVYSWGNQWKEDMCNTFEAGLGRTSPVGLFPASRSPLGMEDAAGNVWEWCSDEVDTKKYGIVRVLRGGSWDDLGDYASFDYRLGRHPQVRFYLVGFRLCIVSSLGFAFP